MMRDFRKEIAANAEQLRCLYLRIRETFARKPHGAEHHAACSEFHAMYDSLAFPGGWDFGLSDLKKKCPEAIENSIQFLEVNPFFFRSGYMKEDLLRHLKHVELSAMQIQRIIECAARSLTSGGWREAKLYARLVAAFPEQPGFWATVRELAQTGHSQRAEYRAAYFLKLIAMRNRSAARNKKSKR